MSALPLPAELVEASSYTRELGVGLERVWENVFDWEHLPALHRDTFAAVELLELTPGGYRFALVSQPGDPARRQVLRLQADRAAGAYVVVTEAGPGARAEVRTRLTPLAPDRTRVDVRFMAPPAEAARVQRVGEQLQTIYRALWDEDEDMMRRRADMLARQEATPRSDPLRLGREDAVRARAPLTVDFGAEPVRIAVVAGELRAFSALCPHWLGPLDAEPVEAAVVRCPWHDYTFDLQTGESADGRGLKLRPCPTLTVEDGEVWLRPRLG